MGVVGQAQRSAPDVAGAGEVGGVDAVPPEVVEEGLEGSEGGGRVDEGDEGEVVVVGEGYVVDVGFEDGTKRCCKSGG